MANSNIVKHRYGLDDEQAAWQASIILAVPLIIYPFLGTFIDHAGKRAWMLLITAGLLIGTHVLLLIPYSAIPIPPTVPMLLFALSLSLGTLSIVTSMPVLTKHVPTGLGLHRSIDNIGATLFGTVSGMMQDFSGVIGPDGETDTENFFDRLYHHFFPVHVDEALQEKEDTRLLGLFLAVAILTFIACSIFVWGDYHWTDGEGGKTGLVNGVYGRTPAAVLAMGVRIEVLEEVMHTHHEYPTYDIDFRVFRCQLGAAGSEIHHLRVHDHRWVTLDEMGQYRFPDADAKTLARLLDLDH